jgi:hypothetical protein
MEVDVSAFGITTPANITGIQADGTVDVQYLSNNSTDLGLGREFISEVYVLPEGIIEEQIRLTEEERRTASKGMMEAIKGLKLKREYLLHSVGGKPAVPAAVPEVDEYGTVLEPSPKDVTAPRMPLRFRSMGSSPWHAAKEQNHAGSPGKRYVDDLRRSDNSRYTAEAWA